MRERAGEEFTAKDFRTLHGTAAVAESLALAGPQDAMRARQRAVAEAMRQAATVLGNTPAIARSSYVNPRLLDAYEEGRLIDISSGRSVERELLSLLRDAE